jgi:glycosyltransferase involved in cell wall biosynthesis
MGLAGTIQIIDSLSSVETRLLVQGSRAIIMPSLYETIGIALLDAMSFGRPIIWSGVDGLRELVGDAALTFDPHRPDDLASVLERIESNAAMLDLYASRAKRRIDSLQTPQQVADKYLCILREAQAKCQTSR